MNLQFSTIFLVLFAILSLLLVIALVKQLITRLGDRKKERRIRDEFTISLGLDDGASVNPDDDYDTHLSATENSQVSATENSLAISGGDISTSSSDQEVDQHINTSPSVQSETSPDEPSEPGISTDEPSPGDEKNKERREAIRRHTERQAFEMSKKLIEGDMRNVQSSYDAMKDEGELVGTETENFFTVINENTIESNESYFDKSKSLPSERPEIEQLEQLIIKQLEKIREQNEVIEKLSAQIKNQVSTEKALTNNIFESSKINSLTNSIANKDRQIRQLKKDIAALHRNGFSAPSKKSDTVTIDNDIGATGAAQIKKLLENLKLKHIKVGELEKRLHSLQTDHTDFAVESDKWSIRIRKLEAELDTSHAECRAQESKLQSNSIEKEERTKELGIAYGKVVKLESRVSELTAIQSQNTTLEREIDSLSNQNKELAFVKTQLTEREDKIKELEKQLSESQAFDQNNAELDSLYKDLRENGDKIVSLETRLQQSTSQNHSITIDKSALSRQIDLLNGRITQLESTEVELRAKMVRHSNIDNDLRLATGRAEQLDIELQKSGTEINTLRTKLDESIKEKEKLAVVARDQVQLNKQVQSNKQAQYNKVGVIDSSITGQKNRASNIVSIDAANQSLHSKKKRSTKPATPCDDLKNIHGIGKKIEKILYKSGYTTYEQIAGLTKEDIASLAPKLGSLHNRIKRDGWKKSARILAHQKRKKAA